MGKRVAAAVLTLALAGTWTWAQTPLGSAFTYQGRLTDNGTSPTGAYDFRFILYSADVGGSQVGPVVSRDDVTVTSGLFTVSLDFGPGTFAGSARFLEIGVRPGSSSGVYAVLSSRVEMTPSPNALFAEASLWSGLTGVPAGFADGVDDDSGGDITAVAAGDGLTGGGATGGVSLGVSFAGSGTGISASRSDHDHAGIYAGTAHDHLGEAWSGSLSPGLTVTTTGSRGLWGQTAAADGRGVAGVATSSTGAATGVWGESASTDARGVSGRVTAPSGLTFGVTGQSNSTDGRGLWGYAPAATGATYGVYAESASISGRGVFGWASSATGAGQGVHGRSSSAGGRGVFGEASAASGQNYGVYGQSASTGGFGLYARATATTGLTYGAYGLSSSDNGVGVGAFATATSGATYGLWGQSNSPDGVGAVGWATSTSGATYGLWGQSNSPNGVGVIGWATSTSGLNYGIYGFTSSPSGYAGYFQGHVQVTGALSKASGSFKIDHPLDPEHKYLYHSFVESPDMMNIYNGNAVLDAKGEAVVELPDWFEALNRDFRYQLTCIGGFAPVFVAEKVQGARFRIGGGAPGLEVSWQVTGIRKDAWAEKNRVPVEEVKPTEEQGTYLHPGAFDQLEEKGVDFKRRREAREGRREADAQTEKRP